MKASITNRRSVRTYDERSLPDDVLNRVEQLLVQAPRGPFGNDMRFALIERDHARRTEKVKLGTYGFIKGAPYFVAGSVRRTETAELDFGFVFEHLILQFTSLGLGTCWLGGSLKRKEYAKLLKLGEDDFVPCITPLGYAASERTLRERFTRWNLKADRRRPFEERFFDETFQRPLSREKAGTGAELLEMVRLAPSADNAQPWRIVRSGEQFHFYLKRSTFIGKVITAADLQRVDMGIAMCHFQLAAGERHVEWTREVPAIEPPPGIEYVTSASLG